MSAYITSKVHACRGAGQSIARSLYILKHTQTPEPYSQSIWVFFSGEMDVRVEVEIIISRKKEYLEYLFAN